MPINVPSAGPRNRRRPPTANPTKPPPKVRSRAKGTPQRRTRPAVNLKRIKSPAPRFDLKRVLIEEADPRTGQPRHRFESRVKARS